MIKLAQTSKQTPHPLKQTEAKKRNKALDLLERSVTRLMNSQEYKAALRFRNKLSSYSFRNAWLIYTQRPDATLVAGYRKWQELGRQVRKGEKALGNALRF